MNDQEENRVPKLKELSVVLATQILYWYYGVSFALWGIQVFHLSDLLGRMLLIALMLPAIALYRMVTTIAAAIRSNRELRGVRLWIYVRRKLTRPIVLVTIPLLTASVPVLLVSGSDRDFPYGQVLISGLLALVAFLIAHLAFPLVGEIPHSNHQTGHRAMRRRTYGEVIQLSRQLTTLAVKERTVSRTEFFS